MTQSVAEVPAEHTAGLLPCPFCGNGNVKVFGPYGWYRQYGISHSCASFYSGTSDMMQGFHSASAAAQAWNTRTASNIARSQGDE